MSDAATAFVPGHVTGFFSAHPDEDPLAAGSRGAGVTLADGVQTTVVPTDGERAVVVNGEPTGLAPVGRVLDALGVDARVTVRTDLPVGAGFGVSGAAALGTALSAAEALECARSENDLAEIAHAAEVEAGTGLGDVIAQARGGLPIRLEPGAPGHGRADGIPARPSVEYRTFGGIDTGAVIGGDTDALSAAGEAALSRLVREPTVERFMAVSRQFAREAGLLTPRVESVIADVRAAGGEAAMAMLGETVFALDAGLSAAGYDAASCAVHPTGATLERE